jgi:hypothetical protein
MRTQRSHDMRCSSRATVSAYRQHWCLLVQVEAASWESKMSCNARGVKPQTRCLGKLSKATETTRACVRARARTHTSTHKPASLADESNRTVEETQMCRRRRVSEQEDSSVVRPRPAAGGRRRSSAGLTLAAPPARPRWGARYGAGSSVPGATAMERMHAVRPRMPSAREKVARTLLAALSEARRTMTPTPALALASRTCACSGTHACGAGEGRSAGAETSRQEFCGSPARRDRPWRAPCWRALESWCQLSIRHA